MKKRATALLLALLMILPMAGCGVRAQELTKDIEPQALDTTTDLTAGGEAVTAFALSLLRSERAATEGVLISPVSVLNALGMVANGAGGDTLKQLETAAGMSLNQLNDFLYTYRMSLPAACKSCTVSLANSAWVREDFRVEDDFLRSCVNYYGAEMYRSAFDGSLVTDLNRWVSQKTDGMIDRLLEQAPDVLTMLYLVNAACFDARWDTPYTKADLRTGLPFTAANGTQQTADYMTGTESIYLSGNNVTGFVKPYDGGKYAFVALLPDEGVTPESLLQRQGFLAELTGDYNAAELVWSVPKFDVKSSTGLNEALRSLGVTDAFDGTKADFTPLTDNGAAVDSVMQAARVKIDEDGVEAAAYTELVCADSAMMEVPPTVEMELDRPFLFVIFDYNNVPLFVGTVNTVA